MTVVFNDEFEKKPRKEVAEAVDDFEWTFDKRGATLTGVAVRDFREARIPAKVDGRPVVAIGARAFSCNSELTTVVFPENSQLTTIGESAFENCKELRAFEFPAKTKEIGEHAFVFCRALARIVLPPSLRTIEWGAFSCCDSLESVVLPEGLESVGTHAFWSCDSLESVVLPTTLRSLGENAFEKCPSLWTVATPERVDANLSKSKEFKRLRKIATGKDVRRIGDCLFSADGKTLTKFLAKDATRCEIPPGTKRIAPCAFADCKVLATVEFPEGLTEIGEEAFRSCYSLKTLALPASLRKIGKGAFQSCGARTVEFPEGLTEIGENVFFVCAALKSLTFPASLRRIGKNAFLGCDALETVVFPPRSIKLESGAFGAGRGALKKVVFPTGQARFADDERTYAVFYKTVDAFDCIGDSSADWADHYDEPYGPDDDLTFVAPDGSPVAEYAAKNGINRVAPESTERKG